MIFAFSPLALAILFVIVLFIFVNRNNQDSAKRAPGPKPWPLIGNIPFMARFVDSTAAFSALTKQYGNVVSVKLGSMDCVVLSGYETFKKVLCSNFFDARPDFVRINMMFGGNRNNSLAFTDYTESHHKSRHVIGNFSLARNTSKLFETLDTLSTENIVRLVEDIKAETSKGESVPLKKLLEKTVARTFLKYFCSTEVSKDDPELEKFVEAFACIFEEINKPCAGDVLPFLMNFINKNYIVEASNTIRHYVHEKCLKPRLEEREKMKQAKEMATDENNNEVCPDIEEPASEEVDLLDALLNAAENSDFTLENALYSLEDILGGHTAVSHTLIRMLIYIAQNPKVQEKIRDEARATGVASMSSKLPYTEATAWECLRFINSAIVPHKATQDAEIDGWEVKKDTVVFFNNYDLHFSPELWDEPQKFNPERFLIENGTRLMKPNYFIPFSTGRRGCLGQKILMKMSVSVIANLCQTFQVGLDSTEDYSSARCCLAVAERPFRFSFKKLDD